MFSKLNDCVFIHTKQIIKNRIVALLDVRFPRVPSLYVVLRLLEALFPDPKLCCNTHPPSRSNCTLFCLGVQFIPRDLLHIPNSRKIFNVRMKVIFGQKSQSSLFRILRQVLTTVFPAMCYCFTTAKDAAN